MWPTFFFSLDLDLVSKSLLITAPDGRKCSASHFGAWTPEKAPMVSNE